MKLKDSLRSHSNYGDFHHAKALANGAAGTVIAICLASAFFIILITGFACYVFYRKKDSSREGMIGTHKTLLLRKKNGFNIDKPFTFRKPSAVRSPNSGTVTGLRKASPSSAKSTPGSEKSDHRSSDEVTGFADCETGFPSSATSGRVKPFLPISPEETEQDLKTELDSHSYILPNDTRENESGETKKKSSTLGNLIFRLKYNYEKQALCVTIVKCTDLPTVPHQAGSGKETPRAATCDPYVKLQLLPDKQHKVKTRVLRKTQNPTYDEDFTFYGITPDHLQACSLHFTVLNFDRYSRDTVIGELVLQLAHLEFDTLEKQIYLEREIQPRHLRTVAQGLGEMLISLCHQPAAHRLTAVILKARNLPRIDATGMCDPYVKIYMVHNGVRVAKKKTHVKRRTASPIFNESFIFDIPYGGAVATSGGPSSPLDELQLELSVYNYDRVTKHELIGRLTLGSAGSEETARRHWTEVASAPRRQIAEWHKLH